MALPESGSAIFKQPYWGIKLQTDRFPFFGRRFFHSPIVF